MQRGLVIHSDGDYYISEIHNADEECEIVGGDVEYILLNKRLSLVINEMGKVCHLHLNIKATQILRTFLATDDWIAGDAIVVGLDKDDNICSLTEEQMADLLDIIKEGLESKGKI